LGVVAGLIAAALVCGLIANLSLIEQHLALIADDIEEMRAREAGELETDKEV
jgi:predicted histidine transporter YuiF (NhaC family)